jgi:hypothetical protein
MQTNRGLSYDKQIAKIMKKVRLKELAQLDKGERQKFARVEVDPHLIAVLACCSKESHTFLPSLVRHIGDGFEPMPQTFVHGVMSRHLGNRVERALDESSQSHRNGSARLKNFELLPEVRRQLEMLPPGLLVNPERLLSAAEKAQAHLQPRY